MEIEKNELFYLYYKIIKMATYQYFNSTTDLNSVKLAACFDLDWTLIRPKKSKFPKSYDDNVLMPNRVDVLKKYIAAGYVIVIFTNQKISKKENLQFKLNRINDIIKKFRDEGINVIIYMATEDDKYRKPNTGMWDEFRKSCPKLEAAFYCGDAAGRPGDFSDSDLKFAENIKIGFFLPEEVFGL